MSRLPVGAGINDWSSLFEITAFPTRKIHTFARLANITPRQLRYLPVLGIERDGKFGIVGKKIRWQRF